MQPQRQQEESTMSKLPKRVNRSKLDTKDSSDSLSLIEQMKRELTCQFCLGIMDDPRLLGCLHSYCKQCISQLEIKNMPSRYKCPECQETFKINDIDKLPVHKIANTKKRDMLLMKRVSSEAMKCELCPVPHKHAAPAIYLCLDCREGQQFLCHECSTNHYNKPELADHQLELLQSIVQTAVSSPNEKKGAGASRKTLVRRSSMFSSLCSEHALVLRHYCENCKLSICNECKSHAHSEHTISDTSTVLDNIQQIIPTELLYVIGIRDGLQQSIDPLAENRRLILAQKDYLSEEIQTRVSRIKNDLEHEERILQNQLNKAAEAKVDFLARQTREIKKLVQRADQIADMLADVDKLSSQSDVLATTRILLDKVDALKSDYNSAVSMSKATTSTGPLRVATLQHQLSLTPCEEPNMGLILNADLIKTEIRDKSQIFTTTACASLCKASGPALSNLEALKLTYFLIRVKDKAGIPCTSLQNVCVKITLEGQRSGRTLTETPKVSHKGTGLYSVQYCPRDTGECTIDVCVNDAHIDQSPFTVTVVPCSPLAVKSKLFESNDSITFPVGVAHNCTQNKVLVTNSGRDSSIIIMDGDTGEVTAQIRDEQNMLKDPCGITSDSEGNIYITSSFYHCILKYSPTGEFIRRAGKIGRGTGDFQNPKSIRWFNGEVYVCDSSNCRVSVFDCDLDYQRCISTDLTGSHSLLLQPSYPCDVALDASGRMFVSDTINDCVLVFKNECFTTVIQSDPVFRTPKGIAVDQDGYLFISDSGNHRIAVYDSSSYEAVGTIDIPRKKNGHPNGIAVDNNGSIYTCNESDKQVIVLSDTSIKGSLLW